MGTGMTHVSQNEIDVASALASLLERAIAEPVDPEAEPNYKALEIAAFDTRVSQSDTVARVPIRLNQPSNQTMVIECLTANGTAVQGIHFTRVREWLVFQPGEQSKVIEIPILKPLGDKELYLKLISRKNIPLLSIAKQVANIGDNPAYVTPVAQATRTVLHPKPTGLSVVFEDDFSNPVVTSSGFDAIGVPCWKSHMGHGFWQNNGELGIYSDPENMPGTQPHIVEDGKFYLQAEYWPDGVPNAEGGVWNNPNKGVPFQYSAPMITTQRLFDEIGVGTYVEARMGLPLLKGMWPACWLLIREWSEWPLIEIDMFEGFFNRVELDRMGTTLHWKDGGHKSFASFLPYLDIDLAEPHTWGLWWGEDQLVFYCDDVPYFAFPNVYPPDRKTYLKINAAVGGQAGTPQSPDLDFPQRMPVEWVRIWQ